MTPGLSPTTILNQVARSLVAKERYTTVEEALWELALSAVRSKIASYRRRIKKLENKYGMDFEQFSKDLENRASPNEEDDWFAWRSAQNMLVDWKKTYQEMLHARPF